MTSVARIQREVLARLIDLADEQECALDTGDLVALNGISQLRARVVRDAAAYLPPVRPWEDEVADLVAVAHQSMARVQQSVQACMAVVRRQRKDVAA